MGFPEASGVIYKFEKDGSLSSMIGYPIVGSWLITSSLDVVAVCPSPGSFTLSSNEYPERADASKGIFATFLLF